ncbi:MAG TPA: T3SS effector HopA1 family protein [Myxococcaceae bacterium]|nr:T3SS effector HopA1 family protein [Myxococcaceae bacterium]
MTSLLEQALLELSSSLPRDPAPSEAALRDLIYERYFTRWNPQVVPVDGRPDFVAALEAAAAGFDCWEPGYRVAQLQGDWAYVTGPQLTLFVDDRRSDLQPPDAKEGDEVRVRVPCARPNLTPGFFYFLGRAGPVDHSRVHVKLYCNLSPSFAPVLLHSLLTLEGRTFEGKLVNDPEAYCRADTAVLYIAPADLPPVLQRVRDFHALHPDAFREGAPLMTREVLPGIGLAESPLPPPGQPPTSFGQHRCGLVASAVHRCLRGALPPAAWMDAVRAAFAAEGLSADRPWCGTLEL